MTNYRRSLIEGATYFFTVNCNNRYNNIILLENIDLLRQTFRKVKQAHPFKINAIVVLPDHMHCIWTLPIGDADYKTRWSLIKGGFSRNILTREYTSISRKKRGERGIWQRRYWEHLIRDERDYQTHVDYIHWNPVKHGWVNCVKDWPHSSFHRYVRSGILLPDWADEPGGIIEAGE